MAERGNGSGTGEAGEPPTVNDVNTVPVMETGGTGDDTSSAVSTTILKASTTKTPTPAAEILRADAGDVEATTVSMERSGADKVTGQRVIMNRSGARTVETRSAQLDRSGVVTLKGEHAVLHSGSAVALIAKEARLVKSKALLLVANQAELDAGSRVFIHVGTARIGGEAVRPTMDTAGATGFGAAFGLMVVLLGAFLRRGNRSGTSEKRTRKRAT